ncbi:hypothetical protein AB5N19_07825 [Seiridium cardinale]
MKLLFSIVLFALFALLGTAAPIPQSPATSGLTLRNYGGTDLGYQERAAWDDKILEKYDDTTIELSNDDDPWEDKDLLVDDTDPSIVMQIGTYKRDKEDNDLWEYLR